MSSNREQLEELLSHQAAVPGGDPAELKTEWLADLGKLFVRLEDYLREYKLLRVEPHPVDLDESALGKYQAPGLRITSPVGRRVDIVPKGRLIVGAIGRVDLLALSLRAMLVRFAPGDWKFVTRNPTAQGDASSDDLTAESFAGVLKELLG